jgi:hypothetical protein
MQHALDDLDIPSRRLHLAEDDSMDGRDLSGSPTSTSLSYFSLELAVHPGPAYKGAAA